MPPEDPLELTICVAIPTYGRERVLVETIGQVLAQEPAADEILVIDQSARHEPDTEAYLAATDRAGLIRWIRQATPNLPAARNRALAETECDLIVFIDDDVRLAHDFVGRHLENYGDPRVVAVAGRILQPTGFRYPNRRPPWPRLMDYLYFPLNGTARVEGVASFGGGNHSARTEYLRRIGGYDENYRGYAYREDSDAAIRIWQSGGLIVFDPSAKLEHLGAPTGGCRLRQGGRLQPEWLIALPASYFAWRHFFPGLEFWRQIGVLNVRQYILRRDNVFHPWRLPWAVASYGYACVHAACLSMREPRGVSEEPIPKTTSADEKEDHPMNTRHLPSHHFTNDPCTTTT